MRSRAGKLCVGISLLGVAAAITGCGGSSSSNSGSAFVRSVNAIYNSGTGTTISYNGSVIDGTVPPLNYTSYIPLGTGTNSFTFSLSNQTAITYPTIEPSLASDYYTAFLIGNEADTTSGTAGYPHLDFVTDDRTIPAVGDGRARFVQTAPDAPNVDIYVNGTLYQSNVAYGVATPYANFPSGPVNVLETVTGTQTAVSQFSTTLSSPNIVSILLVETQASPPTYGFSVLQDG